MKMKKLTKKIASAGMVLALAASLAPTAAFAATVTESEPNNDRATANAISVGDTVTGSLGSTNKDSYDYYKLVAPRSGTVRIGV